MVQGTLYYLYWGDPKVTKPIDYDGGNQQSESDSQEYGAEAFAFMTPLLPSLQSCDPVGATKVRAVTTRSETPHFHRCPILTR